MLTGKMAHGLPKFSLPKGVCEGCLLSKQTRAPFLHKTKYRATRVLELVHEDFCGPITPETRADNRYFLLLVDDFARVMWIYILNGKDGAFGALKKFKMMVEYKSGEKLRVLHTDRGGEFNSKEFVEFFEKFRDRKAPRSALQFAAERCRHSCESLWLCGTHDAAQCALDKVE